MSKQLSDLRAMLSEARNAYDPSEADNRPFWADYVESLARCLRRNGASNRDLLPLTDLETALRFRLEFEREDYEDVMDGRTGDTPPSDVMLARASAIVDLLVQEGKSVDVAAQTVTRKLLLAGVNPPEPGGDSRGWMRLVRWRRKLLEGFVKPGVAAEYEWFRAAAAELPAGERVNRVLTEQLWDRRAR